jgi:hypothetical protein
MMNFYLRTVLWRYLRKGLILNMKWAEIVVILKGALYCIKYGRSFLCVKILCVLCNCLLLLVLATVLATAQSKLLRIYVFSVRITCDQVTQWLNIMLSVIMLSVIMLSVIMLSVMAPALATNIRTGCKILPGTISDACFFSSSVTKNFFS